MKALRILFGPLILAISCVAASAEDWPQWRGPQRNGVWVGARLPDKLPSRPEPRWRRPLGGGYGGIAVCGGRLYVLDRQTKPREVERVVCLDARTSKPVWTHEYAVTYGKLEFGNGPRATPTVHAGRVYAFGALGHLHCLEADSGKVIWSRDTMRDFKGRAPTWGHACSPLFDDGRLIVQVGGRPDACLVALDAATGKEVWRTLADRPGYGSPFIVETPGGRQLVYWTPEHIVGLEPQTGKVRWQVPFEGITYDVAISDLVFADGVLLASNYWSGSKALRLDEPGGKPEVAWEGKQLSLLMSTPLVRGGHVYALDRRRGLMCLEMRSGKVLWQDQHVTPRGTNPQATLVWAGERALILNERGELLLAELKPEGCRILGKLPLLGPTWAHPAFAEGCIFARNDEEIICVPLGR
jgi:outer membrane protein assembly factor BamB